MITSGRRSEIRAETGMPQSLPDQIAAGDARRENYVNTMYPLGPLSRFFVADDKGLRAEAIRDQ